jgi:GNAT superfamily N-acetyltransferase
LEPACKVAQMLQLFHKPDFLIKAEFSNNFRSMLIMSNGEFIIRNAYENEFPEIGQLMVLVYSQLEGFPSQKEQPAYYEMLAKVGELTKKPGTEILVAFSREGKIAGAVVYFSDMRYYGSGGIATQEKNASGFRLLAVDPEFRGKGIGKLLTLECISISKKKDIPQLIIHTTRAMQTAWHMYEKLGFKRSVDLDFMQGELAVFGFRLKL